MERGKNEHQRQAFFNLFNDVSHAKDDLARAAALYRLRKIRGDSVHVSIVMSMAHAHAIGQRDKYLQTNTREAKRDMQLASAVAAYIGLDNDKVCNPYRNNKTTDGQTFVLDTVQSIYTATNEEEKPLLDEHYRELYGKTCPELIAQIDAPAIERRSLVPIDAKKLRAAAIGAATIGTVALSIVTPANAAQNGLSRGPDGYTTEAIQTVPSSLSTEIPQSFTSTNGGEISLNPVAPPDTDTGEGMSLDPVAPPDDGEDNGEINLDPVAPPDNSEPTAPPTEQPPAPVEPTPPVIEEPVPTPTEPTEPTTPPKPPEPPKPAPPVTPTPPSIDKPKNKPPKAPDDKKEKGQEIKVTGWAQNAGGDHELTYYNQWKEPWASDAYHYPGGSGNVNKCGCAPTSFASMISTMTGKDVTPKDTAKFFMEHGAHSSAGYCGSNHIWGDGTSSQKALEKEYGVKIYNIAISDAAFKKVIDAGGMVYMSQGRGMFTSGGHIMAVSGYNNLPNIDGGNHKYLVSDSNSSAKTNDLEGFSPSVLIGNGRPDTKAGLSGVGGTRGYVKAAWAVIPTKKIGPTSSETPKPKSPEAITPIDASGTSPSFVESDAIVPRNKFNAHHVITSIPTRAKQKH